MAEEKDVDAVIGCGQMQVRGHFRAHARRTVALSATVSSPTADWNLRAKVVDLGLGGACVEMQSQLPLGEAVQLSLTAPQRWDPVVVDAEIAWVSDVAGYTRVGMRFRHGAGSTLRALLELLRPHAYE